MIALSPIGQMPSVRPSRRVDIGIGGDCRKDFRRRFAEFVPQQALQVDFIIEEYIIIGVSASIDMMQCTLCGWTIVNLKEIQVSPSYIVVSFPDNLSVTGDRFRLGLGEQSCFGGFHLERKAFRHIEFLDLSVEIYFRGACPGSPTATATSQLSRLNASSMSVGSGRSKTTLLFAGAFRGTLSSGINVLGFGSYVGLAVSGLCDALDVLDVLAVLGALGALGGFDVLGVLAVHAVRAIFAILAALPYHADLAVLDAFDAFTLLQTGFIFKTLAARASLADLKRLALLALSSDLFGLSAYAR